MSSHEQEKPRPAEPTLPEKLALAQRDRDHWTRVAAVPGLSHRALQIAVEMARSSKAAVALYQRALDHRQAQS